MIRRFLLLGIHDFRSFHCCNQQKKKERKKSQLTPSNFKATQDLKDTASRSKMSITGIAHVNLTVLPGTLPLAKKFYDEVLGLTSVPVPALQKDHLAWYLTFPLPSSLSPLPPYQIPHPSFPPTNAPQVRHHPRRPANPHLGLCITLRAKVLSSPLFQGG